MTRVLDDLVIAADAVVVGMVEEAETEAEVDGAGADLDLEETGVQGGIIRTTTTRMKTHIITAARDQTMATGIMASTGKGPASAAGAEDGAAAMIPTKVSITKVKGSTHQTRILAFLHQQVTTICIPNRPRLRLISKTISPNYTQILISVGN